MLPRRSAVIKYVFLLGICVSVLLIWTSVPSTDGSISTWRRLVEEFELIGVNETWLRMEFEHLKTQVNATYVADNKTVEEIYRYIKAMKSKVPVNPHYFKYMMNPAKMCYGQDIFLLVYVHTAPEHHKRRTAIRETWGNPLNFKDIIIKLVFLMGRPKEQNIQDALALENEAYGDIVQETFIDSYRNLTYKAIMGLKWITAHCNHAKFILKTDDDIFVNIFNLVNHLKSMYSFRQGNLSKMVLCLVWYRMKVIRDPKSKWYIPYSEFKEDYFPTYCSGSAYIFTADVAVDMYNVSSQIPFFWVDDFYITGLLAQKVGVKHEKFNSVYSLGPSLFLEKFTEENKWRTLVFGHVHNINHMTHVWNQILKERKQIKSRTV